MAAAIVVVVNFVVVAYPPHYCSACDSIHNNNENTHAHTKIHSQFSLMCSIIRVLFYVSLFPSSCSVQHCDDDYDQVAFLCV